MSDGEHEHLCRHCHRTFDCGMSCSTDLVDGKLLGGADCCDGCHFQGFKNVDTLPHVDWPYGPPTFHETCCLLYEGGDYCDCKASDAEELGWGRT